MVKINSALSQRAIQTKVLRGQDRKEEVREGNYVYHRRIIILCFACRNHCFLV